MTTNYKYSQIAADGTITNYRTLYNTSASVQSVLSSIVVCNQTSSNQTARVAIMSTEGTPEIPNFIVYDASIPLNDTFSLGLGVALPSNSFVRASASSASVSFNAFIASIS